MENSYSRRLERWAEQEAMPLPDGHSQRIQYLQLLSVDQVTNLTAFFGEQFHVVISLEELVLHLEIERDLHTKGNDEIFAGARDATFDSPSDEV